MQEQDFKYVLELLTSDGANSLGQFPVTVDWEPAREHARFLGLRRCAPHLQEAEITVEPVWDAQLGQPYASGARIFAGEVTCEVTRDYFKSLATEASSELVEKKVLQPGDLFLFRILAYRQDPEPADAGGFTMSDATPAPRFVETSLAEFKEGTLQRGDEGEEAPVFIPQQVLDEAEQITLDAGSVETGGILIGWILRDPEAREIAMVVTAQIPARHTAANTTSLTFTTETWTAVRAALALRNSGETILGWWHSHPSFAFCKKECAPERRKACSLQKPFFSVDDVLLHRAVFSKAWNVALLVNNADAGLDFSLFGWCGGVVRSRGFNVLETARLVNDGPREDLIQPSTGEITHVELCK